MLFSASFVLASDLSDQSLNKLLALSGMNKQISALPEMVKAGAEQAKQQATAAQKKPLMSDAEFSELKTAMADAFEPSAIIRSAGAEIKSNVSESDAKEMIVWFESDLGRKITKAEEGATTPAGYQEMMKSAQSPLSDEKRVKFAQKLDKLLNATDTAMKFRERTATAVFIAISTAMHPNQPVNIEGFKSQLSAAIQKGRGNVEQLIILSFVYSYKDIDMDSLEKYGQFLERSATKRFDDSGRKGMMAAMDQSVDRMAKSTAALFKKRNAG